MGDIACATLAAFVATLWIQQWLFFSKVRNNVLLVLLADEEFTRGTNVWLQQLPRLCRKKCFSNFWKFNVDSSLL